MQLSDDAASVGPARRQLAINSSRYQDESVLPSLSTGREAPDFDPCFLILIRQRFVPLQHARACSDVGAKLTVETSSPCWRFSSICRCGGRLADEGTTFLAGND